MPLNPELNRYLKTFASRIISASLAMVSLVGITRAFADVQRPNFIFIITDDQRWDALSVVQKEQGERARFPWLQTPHMDRIAAEGVRFRNAFVTLSLCSPSRAVFLTGTYNHVNEVTNNHEPFPMGNVTYSALMRDAGYQTGFFGKWHHGTQPGPRPGFDFNASFIGQGEYWDCPFEINGKMTPTQGWVDDVTTDFAIDFLKQNREKPFSIFIGFKTPHEPCKPATRFLKLYANEKARLVPNLTTPSIYRFSKEDAERKLLAETAIKEERGINVGLNYFRCVSSADESLGRLLDTLDELKLSENTVLVFTSDNGFFHGEHCLGDKRAAYEESLRVPMLVRYPKQFPKGKVLDDMVLSVDVAPTFLELAGIPVPRQMQGRSLLSLMRGDHTNWRESFLAQYFIEKNYPNTPSFLTLRTDSAKLVKYPGHDEWTELFDLNQDPYETRNLAKDPAHEKLLTEMTVELDLQAKALDYRVPESADKAEFNPQEPKSFK